MGARLGTLDGAFVTLARGIGEGDRSLVSVAQGSSQLRGALPIRPKLGCT